MIKRVYIDTSVVGGRFDKEFEWQTEPFWDAVLDGRITVILSDILEGEIEQSPSHVREFFRRIQQTQAEQVVSNGEARFLAEKYISEKVVGKSSLNDCIHIALATIHRADCLVSWNFKHIVNVARIRGYNGINMLLGYSPIEIRTPYEVFSDET